MYPGRMMDHPLTLTHLLDRAKTLFARTEVVSRRPDRSLQRGTYGEIHRRSSQLAAALTRLGVRPGDRVASLCWNHQPHLEMYLAVPCMGAVLHTLNLRLSPTDLAYIARHAEDKVLVVDRSLYPLWQKFADSVPSITHVIVVSDGTPTEGALDYETLLAAEACDYDWPALGENTAAMICYTSGTTGNPKGVVYSHRSMVLHAMMMMMRDVAGISETDSVMPVVPMFHANAWGLPHAAILAGSKLVFPGPHLDGISLLDLMAGEKVTVSAGVPTIWLGILAALDAEPTRWDHSAIRTMLVGGSAAPQSMIEGYEKRHAITISHLWGMTEMNPVGTFARIKRSQADVGEAKRFALRATQGYAVPLVEARHADDQGKVLPWDGSTMGELEVRGPWVANSYLGDDGADRWTADGWFRTGDVVTIDAEGFVKITDRSKDVIKSGGEWISSVDLENALMAHPTILEAAVFAGRHEKWDERPIAAVVFRPGVSATPDELGAFLAPRFAKFWLPDAYIPMEQIPRTSTGKFLKTRLRDLHGEHLIHKRT